MGVNVKGLYSKFGKEWKRKAIEVQTNMLISYAPKMLSEAIATKAFNNRTKNLIDSYLWIVYYDKKRKGYGFAHEGAQATTTQNFHGRKINGRKLAQQFASRYKSNHSNGWELVLAAVAPYSTYLESGTKHHAQFVVISQIYDQVSSDFANIGQVTFDIIY